MTIHDVQTAVRMPHTMLQRLESIAQREDRSVAWVIRHAITQLLAEDDE